MDYYDGMSFSDSDDEHFAMSGGWAMDDDDHYGYDAYFQGSDEMDDDDDEMDAHASRQYAAPPAPPPPPPPAPTPTLCRFFVLGKCRFGSRCTFSHTLPTGGGADGDATAQAAKTVDCPYFLRGKCKYGRGCRLRHGTVNQGSDDPQLDSLLAAARASVGSNGARAQGAAAPPSAASAAGNQQELTCGICFEDIVEAGKHFGLLSCDHCFCLDCLRAWRQAKEMEVEVTRACPACRVPSNFIVPSLTFCTGEHKNKVVDEYKRHLAFRECKYFDGSLGSCPFGPNCFYAHRNALGEDVKHRDRPRRRRSESTGSAASSSVRGGGRSRRGSGGRRALPEAVASILERYSEFFRLMQSLERDDRGSQPDSH